MGKRVKVVQSLDIRKTQSKIKVIYYFIPIRVIFAKNLKESSICKNTEILIPFW